MQIVSFEADVGLIVKIAVIISCFVGCTDPVIVSHPISGPSQISAPQPQQSPRSTDTNSSPDGSKKTSPGAKKSPDPEVPREFKSEKLGLYSYEYETNFKVVRFKREDAVLSIKDFLNAMASSAVEANDLRHLVNKMVTVFSQQQKGGIKLKSPPLSKANNEQPFFWLIQPHQFSQTDLQNTYMHYLVHCSENFAGGSKNSADYQSRFLGIVAEAKMNWKQSLGNETFNNGAVLLVNLGSPPDQLVIPCPFDNNYQSAINRNLLHVGSYAQYLETNPTVDNNHRAMNFWSAVGIAADSFLQKNNDKTIYLHTHGTGTRYLHFRVDVNLYDYSEGFAPQLSNGATARAFYSKVFDSSL